MLYMFLESLIELVDQNYQLYVQHSEKIANSSEIQTLTHAAGHNSLYANLKYSHGSWSSPYFL